MPNALTSWAPAGSSPARIWPGGLLLVDHLTVAALAVRADRVGRVNDHLAGQPPAVLGDELLEVVEPDGHHEDAGPLYRLVHADRFGVTAQVSRDLPGGLGVAAGQQEVLTASREFRRQRAADGAGADDRHRAVRISHCDSPSVMWCRASSRSGPVRDFAALDFHDEPRVSARQVRGHHRIPVIRLVESRCAGLEGIGAQNQMEYPFALADALAYRRRVARPAVTCREEGTTELARRRADSITGIR